VSSVVAFAAEIFISPAKKNLLLFVNAMKRKFCDCPIRPI